MSENKFEDLLVALGTGRWNIAFFLADAFNELIYPAQYFNGVFIAPEVQHTCLPPENTNYTGISDDSCSYYITKTSADGTEANQTFSCTEWEYDNSTYSTTLTSDFNLVCGQGYQRANYMSIPVIGTILASALVGYFSDRYGRKPVVVVTQVLHSLFSISIVFANSMSVVLILRFCQGCFSMNPLYSLALEVCELRRRSLVGILIALPWALGSMVFGGIAYLIRDWRYLQLAVTLPMVIRIVFLFFIDESPRWLIINGNHDKALQIMKKASRLNKAELPPDHQLKDIFWEIQQEHEKLAKEAEAAKLQEKKNGLSNYIPKLIRTPAIRIRTIIMSSVLFGSALVYTGLTLNGDSYSSDPFLYIILGGLMEVPAYTLAAPVINWIGRKKPAIFWFFFCGIVVLALAFIPEDMTSASMTLAMLGKLSNTMAFMVMFVYMTELFPTDVRMQGFGVSIAIACVGSMISPYIVNYLAPKVPWLPAVLFAIASFTASALFLPLPETLGKPMIETVDCLESQTRKQNRYSSESKEEQTSLTIPEKSYKA